MQNDANSQYNQEEASEAIVVMLIDSRSSPSISRPKLMSKVSDRIGMVGERRIPENLDMDIVIDLLLEQSKPWQPVVDLLMKALLNEIKAAVDIILDTITDQQTKIENLGPSH
jgi:hypothetical protein